MRAALLVLLLALPIRAERRTALFVGENAGDRGDAPLHYAESDAEAMRDVLVRIGGVEANDALLLRGANAAELRGALATLAARQKPDRLFIYVSAHAANGELHLRGSHFPLAELRRYLDESPAGIALLLLDTCEAGAAMRSKGLTAVSSRIVEIERPALMGRVVIASSGPEEAAYESDELSGSLFTRHFIAGLEGAADASHDGRVTLQEAYDYAYARTLESTEAAGRTRQTPVFDLDLQGAGELIITDLSRSAAKLVLRIERPGEWVVSSRTGNSRAARFSKGAGTVELALDPGEWLLRTRVGDFYAEDFVTLRDGGQAIVTDADLRRWPLVASGKKGAGASETVSLSGSIGSGAVPGLGALTGFSLRGEHAFDSSFGTVRPRLSVELAQLTGHPQTNLFFERELSAVAGTGLEKSIGPFIAGAAIEIGAVGVRQQLHETGGTLFGLQPRLDARGDVSWSIAGGLGLQLSVAVGGVLVRTQEERRVQSLVLAQGGVGYTW